MLSVTEVMYESWRGTEIGHSFRNNFVSSGVVYEHLGLTYANAE